VPSVSHETALKSELAELKPRPTTNSNLLEISFLQVVWKRRVAAWRK
jgi:hypothetical protein